MVVETKYVTIDRDELRELREESAELARLRATPSEDGREVPEVVGYTTAGMLRIAKDLPLTGRIGAKCKADDRWNVPLMTVAQHSRIVAAKDAEIERLNAGWHEANKCALESSLAQPARQVGGDAMRLVELLGLVAEKAFHLADNTEEQVDGESSTFIVDGGDFQALSDALDKCDEEPEIEDVYIRDGWLTVLDKLRAALAPAAVVMPDPYGWVAAGNLYSNREKAIQAAEKTPCIEVYSRPQMLSLNRRAIPLELLERLAADWDGWEDLSEDRCNAVEELRALLGKD